MLRKCAAAAALFVMLGPVSGALAQTGTFELELNKFESQAGAWNPLRFPET